MEVLLFPAPGRAHTLKFGVFPGSVGDTRIITGAVVVILKVPEFILTSPLLKKSKAPVIVYSVPSAKVPVAPSTNSKIQGGKGAPLPVLASLV